jgi:hypothetical protein
MEKERLVKRARSCVTILHVVAVNVFSVNLPGKIWGKIYKEYGEKHRKNMKLRVAMGMWTNISYGKREACE